MFGFLRTNLVKLFSKYNEVHFYVWINNTVYLTILNFIYVQRIMYTGAVCGMHGLLNYIDTKAKCRHLKKLTCKEALRQVIINFYIQSVMLVFSSQLCELLPL